MFSRRWFLKSAASATAMDAVPASVGVALQTPDPVALRATIDPLTARMFSNRLAIEAVQGTYVSRFLGASPESLVHIRDDAA